MAALVAGIRRLCADEASTHLGDRAHGVPPISRHPRGPLSTPEHDDHGGIAHAQLTFGRGMIMLGSADDSARGRRIAQPQDIGGRESQRPCLIVTDRDAHYAPPKPRAR